MKSGYMGTTSFGVAFKWGRLLQFSSWEFRAFMITLYKSLEGLMMSPRGNFCLLNYASRNIIKLIPQVIHLTWWFDQFQFTLLLHST